LYTFYLEYMSTSRNFISIIIYSSPSINHMRNSTRKLNRQKSVLSLLVIICLSSIYQCKSSIDEDLTPEKVQISSDVEAASTTSTSSASYTLKDLTLKSAFSIPFGTSVVKEMLDDPKFATVLNREFNSVTPESSMKFSALHPAKDKYDFIKADAIVDYAQSHKMRVHGHTLLWARDSKIPKWVLTYQGDTTAWSNILRDHIHTVVGRYKGRVASWDVINEAINDNGTWRSNIWYRKLGESYITKAFKYAHEADPNAKLFYNDYGQEYGYHKMRTIGKMIEMSKYVDGIGFQMHVMVSLNTTLLRKSFQQMAAAGRLVHLSEMDIQVKKGQPNGFPLSLLIASLSAAKWKEIVSMYLTTVPKNLQWGITTWGISDRNSYWNKYTGHNDYPLLFDSNYDAKLAYKNVVEAALGK
jgi:endo-1,4-beta-xylanase